MLDLRRLRLLVELSRRGTIGAVAQALSYSPSTVSSQLGVLEKEAGVALLEPAGRRLRLTAAGELLVSHGVRLLTELERAETGLAALRGEVVGTVRVAAFQSAVLALLPPALLDLRARHADLRVEVTGLEPEVSLPALAGGDFDLVLAEESGTWPATRARAGCRSSCSSGSSPARCSAVRSGSSASGVRPPRTTVCTSSVSCAAARYDGGPTT